MTTQLAFDQEKVDYSLPVGRKFYRLSKRLSRELYHEWILSRQRFDAMESHFLEQYKADGLVHKYGRVTGFYVRTTQHLMKGFIAEPYEISLGETVYLVSLDVRIPEARACQEELVAINKEFGRSPDLGPFVVQALGLGQYVTVSLGDDGKPLTHCAVAGMGNKKRLLLSVPFGGGFHLSGDDSEWRSRHVKSVSETEFLGEVQ